MQCSIDLLKMVIDLVKMVTKCENWFMYWSLAFMLVCIR